MRVSIKTRKRRLVIATGEDAVAQEAVEWIQMDGADLSIAPDTEETSGEDGEEAARRFGFTVTDKPNIR